MIDFLGNGTGTKQIVPCTVVTTAVAVPSYLEPYQAASRKYGAGFGSLLWASPKTQAVRFKALLQAVPIDGLNVMDVGCGRADLFQYMLATRRYPRSYVGVEGVEALALAAENKHYPNCRIVRGDFVESPSLLDDAADVLLYSGSLNTMDSRLFYACIGAGFVAAKQAMAFNFLCSPLLAGASHLAWHPADEVVDFCRQLCGRIEFSNQYMRGDATIALFKDSK